MKRNDFKKLLTEWKYLVKENDREDSEVDPIDMDLGDLGSELGGLSDEDYVDDPEDYERYHKSVESLSVEEIVAALQEDPELMSQVLSELGVDENDIPESGNEKTPIDSDLVR